MENKASNVGSLVSSTIIGTGAGLLFYYHHYAIVVGIVAFLLDRLLMDVYTMRTTFINRLEEIKNGNSRR